MKEVIKNIQNRGGFDPEQRRGEVELARHVSNPGKEEGVEQASERAALAGAGEDEIGE